MTRIDDHPLMQSIRWAQANARTDGKPKTVWWVKHENDVAHLIDQVSRLVAENERLKAIVDLTELKNERDALKKRVANLEQQFIPEV